MPQTKPKLAPSSGNDIVAALENAQRLAMIGHYGKAQACLDALLRKYPNHVDTLRLKGNIIELEAFADELDGKGDFVHSPEVAKARACYEQALALQPNHIGILADMGTHWKNLGNHEQALAFFDNVIAQLSDTASLSTDHDSFEEALEGKIEILQQQGDLAGAQHMQHLLDTLESPAHSLR